MARGCLGRLGWPSGNNAPYQAPYPLSLVSLLKQIPGSPDLAALDVQLRIHLLVHHAKVPASAVAAPELKELGTVEVKKFEGLEPVSREVVSFEPCQHPV